MLSEQVQKGAAMDCRQGHGVRHALSRSFLVQSGLAFGVCATVVACSPSISQATNELHPQQADQGTHLATLDMCVPDPSRPIDYGAVRVAIRDIPGAHAGTWIDRENLLRWLGYGLSRNADN